jgi:hypothetical protein
MAAKPQPDYRQFAVLAHRGRHALSALRLWNRGSSAHRPRLPRLRPCVSRASPAGQPRRRGQPQRPQLGFFQALAEQDGRVAGWYLGARLTLLSTRNPERLQQVAHSLRELMDKLRPVLGLPAEVEGGRLGDRFAVMTAR